MEKLTSIYLLLAGLLHKQRISHSKNGMFEHQLLNCNESTWVVLMKDVDWLTVAFVDISIEVFQADQSFHAKQVRRIDIN